MAVVKGSAIGYLRGKLVSSSVVHNLEVAQKGSAARYQGWILYYTVAVKDTGGRII